MSSRLKVTLKKGLVGRPADQRGTVRALGLKRIGQTVEKDDRPEIRGMIFKVRHLVEVEEVPAAKPRKAAASEGKR
ncbi:MAG: 50S ribosomal protein L30 [Actinobacteria bacterium]|nr:50S ribosomal protein L30 [Actinomycetota bacterium]MBU1943030.1 50S ribosomal protein L30 [Actinomycetota bacterium]MBU2686912.1 50S ribosomal protein L30 [Actinomycetota bacterium]